MPAAGRLGERRFAAHRARRLAIGAGVAAGAALGIVGAQGAGAGRGGRVLGSRAGVVLLLAHRRIGGYTGDVLGAAAVVGETVGLVMAAARW